MGHYRAVRTVAQIGPLPPPYGGVSVHVRRLSSALSKLGLRVVVLTQPGAAPISDVDVMPLRRFSWQGWLTSGGLRLGADVVHCHEGWEWSPGLLIAAALGVRVVVTVHSEVSLQGLERMTFRYRVASRMLLGCRRVHWIAVSESIADGLAQRGVRPCNISVSPAYIPVPSSDRVDDAIPEELRAFLDAHDPVLTVYGWRVSTTTDGADLYGFDLALKAVSGVRVESPMCGLVVLIPSGDPHDRIERLRDDVSVSGMGSDVCIWTSPLPDPTGLWEATDVLLRPTRSDGDSVSIREVLSLGGRVVASNCCARPVGVGLFASGDPDALVAAINETLAVALDVTDTVAQEPKGLDAVLTAYRHPSILKSHG